MKIGIFRFYNYERGYGAAFGLCEKHEEQEQRTPPPFIIKGLGFMQKVADDGGMECNECGEVSDHWQVKPTLD